MPKLSWLLLLAAACSSGNLDAFSTELGTGGARGGETGFGGQSNTSGGRANGGMQGSGGVAQGPLLIDDFEDGNNQTVPEGGWWFGTDDGTSTLTVSYEAPSTRGAHALRASGSGFKGWCFVGLDFPGQPNLDARAYTRVSFWLRAEPSSVVRELNVDMLDSTNINVMDSTAIHFRKTISLSTEWTYYSLAFAEFVPTNGASLELNRSGLSALQFWVFSTEAFDFSLDDVSLLP